MEMADNEIQSGNLGGKIVAIASGEAHSLALTGDGNVYTWGRGMFGRLGNGKETDELSPVQLEFSVDESIEKKPKFVGIAAGAYHSLALADDGSVWCWGYNICQLGVDGENLSVPTLLEQFRELNSSNCLKEDSERKSDTSLKVRSVEAGGMFSLAIDNRGVLWMWGNCPIKNSDGDFSFRSSSIPIPVSHFYGRTVVKVACGSEHVVALVSPGEIHKTGDGLLCYSWGGNNHGQLGLGHKETQSEAQLVNFFYHESEWSVCEVACGAYHTALLTRKRQNDTLESVCWTFGLGQNGQLGHGTTQTSLLPQLVKDLPQNICLISIDCGLFHTSVLSSDGCVWSWGMEKGLGLCPDASFTGSDGGDAISPLIIPNHAQSKLKFNNPVRIACGAAHTLLLSSNGYKLWSWGRGRNGVLGNGKTLDSYAPTLVSWPPSSETFNQERAEKHNDQEEQEIRLTMAMEEITLLKSKLIKMEKYASILHGSIFGRPFEEEKDIPVSLENLSSYDIAKEWENMLESADRNKLLGLEMFYRNMLAGVKDKVMKRRIQEIVKECLHSSSSTTNNL